MSGDNQGADSRRAALLLVRRVLDRRHALGEVVSGERSLEALSDRDRAHAIALTHETLRQLGRIDAVLAMWLQKPLPASAGPAMHILRLAFCDIGFMNTPPYAAGATAMALAAGDPKARHYKDLVNALVRRAGRELGDALALCPAEETAAPAWLLRGWQAAYGKTGAADIIRAHLKEPPTDFTLVRGEETAHWAEALGAEVLPTGSLRRAQAGRIPDLPGYAEGAWFIQDAAAALPARLLGDVRGQTIIDICAAPGGKTAQLAAAGAHVSALDISAERLLRVRENLDRLKLSAQIIEADAHTWRPERLADGLIIDAPCSASGTIRRHPDLPWIKGADDIRAFAEQQVELIASAAAMVRPGGLIIYAVCSLEPQEGEEVIERALRAEPRLARMPIGADEIAGAGGVVTGLGDLRTKPSDWPDLGGLDGFFACRLALSQ